MNRQWWIYVLREPTRNGPIRYVGVTVNLRARYATHLSEVSGSKKCRWVGRLLKRQKFPVLMPVESGFGDTWREAERFWITHLRKLGANLVNTAQGGNGQLWVTRPVEWFSAEWIRPACYWLRQREASLCVVPAQWDLIEALRELHDEHWPDKPLDKVDSGGAV